MHFKVACVFGTPMPDQELEDWLNSYGAMGYALLSLEYDSVRQKTRAVFQKPAGQVGNPPNANRKRG